MEFQYWRHSDKLETPLPSLAKLTRWFWIRSWKWKKSLQTDRRTPDKSDRESSLKVSDVQLSTRARFFPEWTRKFSESSINLYNVGIFLINHNKQSVINYWCINQCNNLFSKLLQQNNLIFREVGMVVVYKISIWPRPR